MKKLDPIEDGEHGVTNNGLLGRIPYGAVLDLILRKKLLRAVAALSSGAVVPPVERPGRRRHTSSSSVALSDFRGPTFQVEPPWSDPSSARAAGGSDPEDEVTRVSNRSDARTYNMGGEMLLTTTPSIEGRPAKEYLGIVTGEAIVGANIFKDIMAAVRDVVGGRSRAYEDALRGARQEALRELAVHADSLDADAVLGVDLDYEVLGKTGGMLMVTAAGTAVKLG